MKTVQNAIPLLALMLAFNSASCQEIPADNIIVPFATGVTRPVCITNAGDSRLFVVDQAGYIYIIDSGGYVNPEPYLDIQ